MKVRVARAGLTCTCKQVRVARRRAFEETNEFKKLRRHRSGAEATNSQLARPGMKRLRVRDRRSVHQKIILKSLSLNIQQIDG
ncbi:MAG: transposase [Deltaproteobacteria bacterium]|nr:transposase [Deltaproteobacteria bacterium]